MAYIVKPSRVVIDACEDSMEGIRKYRREMVEAAVKREMERTRFSFSKFRRVPIHESEADALKWLKKDGSDFWGSAYDQIQQYGYGTMIDLKALAAMAGKANEITLSSEDFNLIKGHIR